MDNKLSTKGHNYIIKISPLAYDIIRCVKEMRLSNGEPSATLSNIASEAIIKTYQFEAYSEPAEQSDALTKESKQNPYRNLVGLLNEEQRKGLMMRMLSQENQIELVNFCKRNKISFRTDITFAQAKSIVDFIENFGKKAKEYL